MHPIIKLFFERIYSHYNEWSTVTDQINWQTTSNMFTVKIYWSTYRLSNKECEFQLSKTKTMWQIKCWLWEREYKYFLCLFWVSGDTISLAIFFCYFVWINLLFIFIAICITGKNISFEFQCSKLLFNWGADQILQAFFSSFFESNSIFKFTSW